MSRTMSRWSRISLLIILLLVTSACDGMVPRGKRPHTRSTTPRTKEPASRGGEQAGRGDSGDHTRDGQDTPGCPGDIRFTVEEQGGVARPDGFLETGVPLAEGEFKTIDQLAVCDGGRSLPADFSPLSYWPDGSLRWALLRLPLSLKAKESRELTITSGKGEQPPAPRIDLPPMKIKLQTDKGNFVFDIRDGQRKEIGDHYVETSVEILTADRFRIRTNIAQLHRDAFWKNLTVEIAADGPVERVEDQGAIRVGSWTGVVFEAAERGPVTVTGGNGVMRLNLYPGDKLRPYPADEGFHVSHQIIVERNADPRDLARRVASPLHAVFPPAYVAATGAAGILGYADGNSGMVEKNLLTSVDILREAQQKNPLDRGMTNWGDFTANEGAAYMGYYNHEYDPASAIFQYCLHAGDNGPLDMGLDMARHFADNCVNLEGQVYQHRSTTYAIAGTVGDAAGEALIKAWRRGSDRPASDKRILAAIDKLYPPKRDTKGLAHKMAVKTIKEINAQGVTDPTTRERLIANSMGYTMAQASRQEYLRGSKGILQRLKKIDPEAARGRRKKGEVTYRDLALICRAGMSLAPLDKFMPRSVDEIFAPFFARYGGDWDHFPRLHFYDAPSVEDTHSGSHTLVEMLVWGHLLTGDPHLRDMALRIARDFVADGGLVDRTIELTVNMNRNKNMVHIRTAGWTLINLLSIQVLTQTAEPELQAVLDRKTDELLQVILDVPVRKYEGIIHAGVVTEALSRYHHRHRQDKPQLAAKALAMVIDVDNFFVENQWSAGDSRFYYRQDNHSMTLKAGSYLMMLGLAYGGTHAEDSATRDRLLDCARSMLNTVGKPATTPKALGMKFRNTFRGLGILQSGHGGRKGR